MRAKFFILLLFSALLSFAQESFWKAGRFPVDNQMIPQDRMPYEFQTYTIDLKAVGNYLQSAPDYFSRQSSTLIFNIPDETGKLIPYRVYQSHTMSPGLQAKEPGIRAYRAFALNDQTNIASIVVTPQALHIGIFRMQKPNLVVQPVSQDGQHLMLYTSDMLPPVAFECLVDETDTLPPVDLKSALIDDEILRTYRFAVGVTGEYSQFHINRAGLSNTASDTDKKNVVLAAIVVTIDRINTIYERDLSVLLELVPNETDVIFLDPATDPYDNSDIMSMLNDNTTVLNNNIGAANYDGGHLFSTYPGGGISGLGIICSSMKGRSVTGLNNPVGDTYDIDFVAHEIGHAFHCNHTFANSCYNNRNLLTSVEPGSGSTIMGYAGVCSPNIQFHSDDYFHAVSIAEASNFISNYATCSVNIDIGNHKPVVTAVDYGSGKYIPKNTPFMLEATATDADNDALTYCWEQNNPVNSSEANNSSWQPNANFVSGPLFRSWQPATTGVRIFPVVGNIISGTYGNMWEVLPQVNRSMQFIVTVRDNHPGGGQTPVDYVSFQVDANTGPFRITNLTNNESWQVLTDHTITWNVAGTDGGLVNCSSVDILFSNNNGYTFPYIIAEDIPNNGSATFTMPDFGNTGSGRIMIKAHDNYFLDVAKGKISITGSSAISEEKILTDLKVYPNPATDILNISFELINPKETQLRMYDVSGRMIYSQNFEKDRKINHYISLAGYSKGIYFLRIETGLQAVTRKIIIQ